MADRRFFAAEALITARSDSREEGGMAPLFATARRKKESCSRLTAISASPMERAAAQSSSVVLAESVKQAGGEKGRTRSPAKQGRKPKRARSARTTPEPTVWRSKR